MYLLFCTWDFPKVLLIITGSPTMLPRFLMCRKNEACHKKIQITMYIRFFYLLCFGRTLKNNFQYLEAMDKNIKLVTRACVYFSQLINLYFFFSLLIFKWYNFLFFTSLIETNISFFQYFLKLHFFSSTYQNT